MLFVDEECVLCHGLVKFLLRRDRRGRLTFSTLQGETARRFFQGTPHEATRQTLSSVIYVKDFRGTSPRVHERSMAALLAMRELGGIWRILSWLTVFPRPLRDGVYRFIAQRRYRWFGRHEAVCPLPSEDDSERFLP